jgi:DNA-binding transcriptional regulator YiaG
MTGKKSPDQNIAEYVIAWRNSLDLTREQAAELMGVPVRTVEGWELGRPPQHPDLILRMMILLFEHKSR